MDLKTEKPVRILLAEDEEHIAKLVAFKLGRESYQVTIAKNGKEAIELFPSQPWSLVILDVMMPFFDGYQVLKSIRSNSIGTRVPVLMLTAKGDQKDFANAAQLGATDFLKKPFVPDELASTVKKLLNSAVDSLEETN